MLSYFSAWAVTSRGLYPSGNSDGVSNNLSLVEIASMRKTICLRTSLLCALLASPVWAMQPPFVATGPAVVPHDPAATVDGGTVDMADDGSSVVAWADSAGVKVRRLDTKGAPLTPEIPLGVGTGLVSALYRPGGGFVMFYGRSIGNGTVALFARPFDSLGNAGSEQDLQVTTNQFPPKVGRDAQGRFVIGRAEWGNTDSVLWADRYSADLVRQGDSIHVGTVDASLQSWDISVRPDGGFVFFWEDFPEQGLTRGLSGQLIERHFDALGQGAPAQALAVSDPAETRSAASPEGKAVVVYQAPNGSLGAHLFDSSGALLSAFPVYSQLSDVAVTGDPAFLKGGQVAAAFDAYLGDSFATTQLVRFDAAGNPVGGLFEVTQPIAGMDSIAPAVASAGDRLVVLWRVRSASSGNQSFLRFQVFDSTLFADGFETGDLSAWSVAP